MSDYKWYKNEHFDEARKDQYRPGSFGRHEALHSCYIIQENIEAYLLSHMGVLNNKKAWQKIEKAKDLLSEAYTILGLEPQKCKFHDLPIGTKFIQNKFKTDLPLIKIVPEPLIKIDSDADQVGLVIVAKNDEISLTAWDCTDLDVEEVI